EWGRGRGVSKGGRKAGGWAFDPCTCTSHYCPGPVVSYQVQCPGHWTCKRVWVPREEVRTMRCCTMVPREQCHTVNYTVCKQIPYRVMKTVPSTTCRRVPHEPTQCVTCKK